MGCCLVFGILAASPRLILFGMWLFTNYLAQASIAFVWGTVVFALGIVLDIVIYYGGGRSRTQYAAA